eukprot:gene685-2117_t
MKTQHFGKLLLIPPTFLVGFMLCIISIPILDLMVIGFEAFSFLLEAKAGPASVVPFHWRESMIPDAAKGHDLRRMIHARSTIVLEHRKIIEFLYYLNHMLCFVLQNEFLYYLNCMFDFVLQIEFLYFLNRETGVRRFPSKICEVAVYRQQVNVNVNFVKLHELPPRPIKDTRATDFDIFSPIKDSGTDFDISVKQLMANMEAWPTQKLALKLIGNQNVMHNLLHVSLVDCNLTAFYIYGEGDGEGDGAGHGGEPPISPLLELLESESIQTLDLSNNPFGYDPMVAQRLDRMADARLHASLREKQLTYEDQSKAYAEKHIRTLVPPQGLPHQLGLRSAIKNREVRVY